MSHVQTVLGPVTAERLGVTLSHEHVYVFMGEDNHHYPWMFDLQATRDRAIQADARVAPAKRLLRHQRDTDHERQH